MDERRERADERPDPGLVAALRILAEVGRRKLLASRDAAQEAAQPVAAERDTETRPEAGDQRAR
jgi:hypothetical protein